MMSVPTIQPGSRVLVVGGSGGIGAAVVDLLDSGYDLELGVHGHSRPSRVPKKGCVMTKRLTSAVDCFDLVDAFAEMVGGIDHLVVAAGGMSHQSDPLDIEPSDWDHDLFLNLTAPFFLAQRALRLMKESRSAGSVVLFGTASARHGGGPSSLAYGVAKHGIECAVKGLARRAASFGARVNGINPGFIASGFHQRWQQMSDDSVADRVHTIPIGRAGSTSEVAFLVSYLMSEQAGFITGEIISVAGGEWL